MIRLTMRLWRSPIQEVEPARRALNQGRYDVALALLERATKRERTTRNHAQLKLYLASIYALYRRYGLEGGYTCLQQASLTDPDITKTALYKALDIEYRTYRNETINDLKQTITSISQSGDSTAIYHAASTLVTLTESRGAIALIKQLEFASLPPYLNWRCWSLLGRAFEQSQDFKQAARAFEKSAAHSTGRDKQGELLALAGSWLASGRAEDVLDVLRDVKDNLLVDEQEIAIKRYLQGKAHVQLGNPELALELFEKARGLVPASYGLLLTIGQTELAVGLTRRALFDLQAACRLAPVSERSLVHHEYVIALVEAGVLAEASRLLKLIVEDEAYEFRAQALADLAEVRFRLDDVTQAELYALEALKLTESAAACICLGNIAHGYFRLEDAVCWFERAASAAEVGDDAWVMAQKMLTELHAQQRQADRVIYHATQALRFLNAYDDWYLPLQQKLRDAQQHLGGESRLLN